MFPVFAPNPTAGGFMIKRFTKPTAAIAALLFFGISPALCAGLPKPAMQSIIKSLQDANLDVRIAAAQALTQVPDDAAAKPLENALIASSDGTEQDALIRALIAVNDSASVKRLSDALGNPQFTWGTGAKPKAVEAIARIGQRKVIKWLTDILSSEQEPAVRAAAIRALGEIGAPPKKEEKK
jgi:HEAT repeat protein